MSSAGPENTHLLGMDSRDAHAPCLQDHESFGADIFSSMALQRYVLCLVGAAQIEYPDHANIMHSVSQTERNPIGTCLIRKELGLARVHMNQTNSNKILPQSPPCILDAVAQQVATAFQKKYGNSFQRFLQMPQNSRLGRSAQPHNPKGPQDGFLKAVRPSF